MKSLPQHSLRSRCGFGVAIFFATVHVGIAQECHIRFDSAGQLFLGWQGKPGRNYFVQVSDPNAHLKKWNWAPIIESGHGTLIEHQMDGTADKAFFRLQYSDQPIPSGQTLDTADFDADGLTNRTEITPIYIHGYRKTQTNPLNSDTDQDGLADKWERDNDLDPTDDGSTDFPYNGPNGDPDGDFLTNLAEQSHGTNPSLADSDGDGVADGDELGDNFTNPLTATDADSDGIADDFEKFLARQLLAFQADPAYWGTYYLGLSLGNLNASHDYTGDGMTAGELSKLLKSIPAAGSTNSDYRVELQSRRNSIPTSYYFPPGSGNSSQGMYYQSVPNDYDVGEQITPPATFSSQYLLSRINSVPWSNITNGALIPGDYYSFSNSMVASGFVTTPQPLGAIKFQGLIHQKRFRVVATNVNHAAHSKHYLKVIKEGNWYSWGNSEVLAVEPLTIQIPKGKFLSEWYEFKTPMMEGGSNEMILRPVEFKDYYGGDQFLNRTAPKCFAQKVAQKMLTHEYPEKGSDGSAYIQNGDTFDISVRVPELQSLKYELVYELRGMEILRKTILGSNSLQVVKFDPNINEMNPWKLALGPIGFEMKAHLLISKDGAEILKSPDYKFLVDDAVSRNALFKIKVTPLAPGSKMKGSYSEIMMGMMLHEVSLEIVSLVEKNTRDHTVDAAFKLNDPAATQGTNRLIIRTLGDQMGQPGSEWDQAAADALALEQAIGVKFWKYPDVIFNQAFPKFEAIENRVRGEGWGSFGCPCGGDKEVLKQASLRGVSSEEIDKILAAYTPAGTLGFGIMPPYILDKLKDDIKTKKLPDLEKNFAESWAVGGCCE